MLRVAKLSARDRGDLFVEAAQQMGRYGRCA